MRSSRVAWLAGIWLLACASGCNLISGLSDLEKTGGSGGGGGSGGTSTTTTSTTGGSAGSSTGGGGSGSTCSDNEKNGDETDKDCGGPECSACNTGSACLTGTDCATKICAGPDGAKVCSKAEEITIGGAHVCARLDSGAVYCWGANDGMQLGSSGMTESSSPVLVPIEKATAISAGGVPGSPAISHTCALTEAGDVTCWGANGSGQLGTGDMIGPAPPQVVPGLSDVSGVAAGGAFTCAFLATGNLLCWGDNSVGQLGDGGDGSTTAAPVEVADVADVIGLAAGAVHACAVINGGSLTCWGNNTYGQIAAEPPAEDGKLNTVQGLSPVVAVSAGQHFTCSRPALSCWGDNSDAELTSLVLAELTTSPAGITLPGLVDVALGSDTTTDPADSAPRGGHACVVLSAGSVQCWGNDRSGQLGRGSMSPGGKSGNPADVVMLTSAKKIAAGGEVSCAIVESGAVWCWGRNDRGQLGSGMISAAEPSPVAVVWP